MAAHPTTRSRIICTNFAARTSPHKQERQDRGRKSRRQQLAGYVVSLAVEVVGVARIRIEDGHTLRKQRDVSILPSCLSDAAVHQRPDSSNLCN
jgi:hypothetical protein